MMGLRHATVNISRGQQGRVLFELELEGQRLLATENPAHVAAGVFVTDAKAVTFSFSGQSGPVTCSTMTPFNEGDLGELCAIASTENDLAALLSIIYACHSLLDYAREFRRIPIDSVARYWHAGVLLIPAEFIVHRPEFGRPCNWDIWMRAQQIYVHFARRDMFQKG